MIALLLVMHVRLYREGLAAILGRHEGVRIVGISDERLDAVEQTMLQNPDVALVDMSMPGAVDLISSIAAANLTTKTIALGVDEDAQVVSCVEAGASGYITRDSSIDMLVATIESVGRGEMPCSPRMAANIARQLSLRARAHRPTPEPELLTGRQRQVLQLLRVGLSNKEIAQKLNIAEATVKNHVHHLLERLNVPSRTHAAQRASTPAQRPLEFARPGRER